MTHILITGNPVDGFDYTGPFDTASDAADYANTHDIMPDWWVAPLAKEEA